MPFVRTPQHSPQRIVVLISGSGTNLQALIDACSDPGYGVKIVAVGADRDQIPGLERAETAGIPTFVRSVADFETREGWDAALTTIVERFEPDLVVCAGFMKLLGPAFLAKFGGRTINTHPALSPAFPGVSGPQDALDYGVKVTGCTLFLVDEGMDTGVVLAQRAVEVADDDTADSLHERIKVVEREMLVHTVGRMLRDGWSVQGRRARLG